VYVGTGGGAFVLFESLQPATLIGPAAAIVPATPVYTWNAVPDATEYYLWVNDSIGTKVTQWIAADEAGCATGTGTCRFKPQAVLAAGPARWWIQTRGADGDGPWSDPLDFTVSTATLWAPGGAITDTTPMYTWDALAGAAWYQLRVNDSGQNGKVTTWYGAAQAGCGSGTGKCSVTPTTAVSPGPATWAVQAWNSEGYGPWSAAKAFHVNRRPAFPTSRGQRQADGITPIPLGGTAASSTIVFRATVSDPDAGQTVGLQVEVKPVGTAFNGAVNCSSDRVSSGTVASCSVTGRVAGRSYHWQARTVDSLGAASAWVSYATNAETAADFVVTTETPPAPPVNRAQRQGNSTAIIPVGGWSTSTGVVFRGTVNDSDGGQVRLQVEVRPLDTAFTDTASCQSGLVLSGATTDCGVSGLAPGTSYHWQTRAVDSGGKVSAWVSFGSNEETAADFMVNTPPSVTALGQLQANGTTAIPVGGTATSTTVVFRGTISDPDPGQTARLQVEVRLVGGTFTGYATCQSAGVLNGTLATCSKTFTSGSYRWQARTVDSTGTASPWVSYGGNAENAADFVVP
jgi:hypothetical protein